ncbi:MAG: hypothetical protein ACREH3_10460, partial [Geminicoccales bacterium]
MTTRGISRREGPGLPEAPGELTSNRRDLVSDAASTRRRDRKGTVINAEPQTGNSEASRPAAAGTVFDTPRLLFVINDTAFFVSHRLPLALGAQEAGFEVHLAALDAGRLGEIQDHGIAYHRLEVDRTGVNPWHDFQHFRGVL